MKSFLQRNSFLAGALGTATLALGVGAGAYSLTATGASNESTQPVVYTVKHAPEVSPQEARRAVASAKDMSVAFRVAAAQVLPSVVTIETVSKPAARVTRGPRGPELPEGRNPFEGTPFEEFFKDRGFGLQMPPTQPQPQRGMGSGVVIDASGLILTNNHVVAGGEAGEVKVRLHDGREFVAKEVWTDPKTDLAVVKIQDAGELVAAKLGDSDLVSIGDWVLALGQPFGLESTVTAGIISATHRGIGITARESFLQTDAAINPGNSGGPLVNLDGEVIGISTAISSRSGGNEGVGFAIPINLATWVSDQLVAHGSVNRAYLGVAIQPVTAGLAEQFQVKPREGVVVTDVFPQTPAAKAGLQAGDVIVKFAGVEVNSPQDLQLLVERSEIGKAHAMTVSRDGKRVELTFVPEKQPAEYGSREKPGESESSRPAPSTELESLGLEVSDMDASVAEQLGMKHAEGVVITSVQPDTPAARAGLEPGMVIVQVDRQPVKNAQDAAKALEKKQDDGHLLLVRTAAGSRFIVVK